MKSFAILASLITAFASAEWSCPNDNGVTYSIEGLFWKVVCGKQITGKAERKYTLGTNALLACTEECNRDPLCGGASYDTKTSKCYLMEERTGFLDDLAFWSAIPVEGPPSK
ncbi:hypothetical protein SMMN14_02048 [Sphaerulina musiva]